MIPDRDYIRVYLRVFHSPGLEPWILGLLIATRPRSILDVGCGYGFWGFVVRSCVSGVDYIVGLDLDFERVVRAGGFGLYDGVVVANAVFPPFREGVFDVVLAVDVLHGLDVSDLIKALESHKAIVGKMVIATFPGYLGSPGSSGRLCKLLKSLGFSVYRYLLRGFVVIGEDDVYILYDTMLWRIVKLLLKILVRIFPSIACRGYLIAVWSRREGSQR